MHKLLFGSLRGKLIAVFMAVCILVSFFVWQSLQSAGAASIVWNGAGETNDWTDADNWVGGIVPDNGDIATFDDTSIKDVTIDDAINVAGILIDDGYTGTITQTATMTIGASGFVQNDGAFAGGAQDIDLNGPFLLTNGVFTSTSGEMFASDHWTHSGGTFNHNLGTVTFDGNVTAKNITLSNPTTFHNVTLNKANGNRTLVWQGASEMTVEGALTLTRGTLNGDTALIIIEGTVSSTANLMSGTLPIEMASATTWSHAGLYMNPLRLNHTDAVFTNASGTYMMVRKGVTVDQGTFNAGTELRIVEDLHVATGATFNHDDGLVKWMASNFGSNGIREVSISGSIVFHDLLIESAYSEYFYFDPDGTYEIAGELTVNNSSRSGSKIYLVSATPGEQVDITFTSATTVNDVTLQDVNVVGASFACLVRCVDGGNNGGIFDVGYAEVEVSALSSSEVSEDGGTSALTLKLAKKPTEDVAIQVISSDTSEATVAPATLIFTSANYWIEQTVTITGVDDEDHDGGQNVTISFAVVSDDASYDGMVLPTRTLVNSDDDADATTIAFTDLEEYAVEDVKASGDATITHFEYGYYGMGNFRTGDGGLNVDITNSKIAPGCKVVIEGETYRIASIAYADDGYVSLAKDPEISPLLEMETLAPTGTVDAIYCATVDRVHASLSTGFIPNRIFENQGNFGSGIFFDALNDAMWTINASNDLIHVDQVTGVVTEIDDVVLTSTGSDLAATIDPVRGILWWANYATDQIYAFDGATATYAFGSKAASTFSVTDKPIAVAYDSTQDAIWVLGDSTGAALQKFDASDGSLISTLDLSSTNQGNYTTRGLIHDVTNNAMWAVLDSGDSLLKVNAATALPYDTDIATSTYPAYAFEQDFINRAQLWHDPNLNQVFFTEANCDVPIENDTVADYIAVLNADDGSYKKHIKIPVCPYQSYYDVDAKRLYTMESFGGSVVVVDMITEEVVRYSTAFPDFYSIAVDSEGDVWVTDAWNPNLYEYIFDGAPFSNYYTLTTTDDSQVDVSEADTLLSVEVSDDADDQFISYALSFDDRESYKIYHPASEGWKTIVASTNAIHGGDEGVWHYLDSDDVWQVAPIDSKESALSSAAEEGHQMTGALLATLGEPELVTAEAFVPETTTSVNLGVTFFTDNPREQPSVNYVRFSSVGDEGGDEDEGGDGGGGGGGSSGATSALSDLSVTTNACTPDSEILLTLNGSGIADYLLSESANMNGSTWQTFTAITPEGSTVPFTVSGIDGEKTVYVRFRDHAHNQSSTYSVSFTLNSEGCEDPDEQSEGEVEEEEEDEQEEESEDLVVACDNVPRPPISAEDRGQYRTGLAPAYDKSLWPLGAIRPGDLIRGEGITTVYCIHENNIRRPYIDETTYFTHTPSFSDVKWVQDASLTDFTMSHAMLPKEGSTLVKFESTEQVYTFRIDEEDSSKATLHWITTEELARAMIGDNWSDYVIDLNPALFQNFTEGDPIFSPESMDLGNLKPRLTLREAEMIGAQGSGGSLLKRAVSALEGAVKGILQVVGR